MKATTCMSVIACAGASFGVAGSALGQTSGGISADEARALVSEMMADAEERSSLLQLEDTRSTVEVGGAVQFRYIANFGDDGVDDQDDFNQLLPPGDSVFAERSDFENGFQFGNTQVWFEGEVGDGFAYYVRGNFVGEDTGGDFGSFVLEDAYITYDFGNNWSVKAGQFKLPFSREELVDDFYQLAVDRSLTNEVFGGDRTEGVALTYQDDNWRATAAVTDGFGGKNTAFNDNAQFAFDQSGDSDFSTTIRAEYKGGGTWDQFVDFTSMPGSEFAWLIGGAFHWETGDPEDDAAGNDFEEYDGFGWTVDASLEGDGWNVFLAYVGLNFDDEPAPDTDRNTTNHGLIAQGGFFIPDTDWELFARYDLIVDEGIDAGPDEIGDGEVSTLTFGTNYYIHGHAAKFTVDVQWVLSEASESAALLSVAGFDGTAGSVTGLPELGFLGDDDENEVAIRGQFQLLF